MSVNSKMTAIADAIRGKTGGTNPLTLDQMATAIAEIQTGGGGDEMYIALSNDTLSDYSLPSGVNSVRAYLFAGSKNLKTANLSALDVSGGGMIGTYAFYQCEKLESVVFPSGQTGIQWMGSRAFSGCKSLKEVYISVSCTFSTLATYLFADCTALTKFVAPLIRTSTTPGMFRGCSALTLVDVMGGGLGQTYFERCSSMTTLVLRNDTVVTLANINAFQGTPFASGGTGGRVYVPAALIESYQTATNWSTLYASGTCNFAAIEGSEYE